MNIGPMVEDDLLEISEILGASFAYPPIETPPWLDQGGRENVRVLRDGARPVACLLEVPMGHFFGGRSVPTCGVAGVGVALDKRKQGFARALMRGVIEEQAAKGTALSTLYPATQTLYRRAGYERAGKLVQAKVPLPTLSARALDAFSPLDVRPLAPGDAPAVEALYGEVARTKQGWLDRGPYIWSRVRTPRGKVARGFGFFGAAGRLEGYVYMAQQRPEPGVPWHDVRLTDGIAVTPAAAKTLLRFLVDQRSMANHVILHGGPSEALLTALDEPLYEETSDRDWMVRVCHVERALASRGYPAHVRATVALEVADDLISQNRGPFTLEVEGGVGRVQRGAAPASAGPAKLDVLALAPLYTGYLSATALRRLGRLDAGDATVAALESVFGGPMPSMGEMF